MDEIHRNLFNTLNQILPAPLDITHEKKKKNNQRNPYIVQLAKPESYIYSSYAEQSNKTTSVMK